MMVIKSQNCSIENNRVKEPSKAKMAQEEKLTKVGDKVTNNGLRVPGSNWEKYKSLVTDSKPKNRQPGASTLPRKRQRPIIGHNNRQEHAQMQSKALKQNYDPPTGEPVLTRQVAIDCEMVGIGDGNESMLARVSIVNKHGVAIYDKYVKPTEKVTDYRSAVSGIYPHHLKDAEEFKIVQKEVAEILKGRLLVGHAMKHDLEVLYLSHPRFCQRDTSRYKPFKKIVNGNTPSLKKLTSELLGIEIQSGEHDSVEDARSAMQLYMLYRKKWETELRSKKRK